MLVKDIVSEDVVYVSVPGTREKALEIIVKENVSVVPVVKEGSKKLVGILTRSDLITNPDEEQIAMLMTRDLVTAEMDEPLEKVAKNMVKYNVRRVPVVDGEDLVGIVTAFDLVSLAIADNNSSNSMGSNSFKCCI
jgi:CBS domain-containing protein